MARKLSDNFMKNLKYGFLNKVLIQVKNDNTLDLQIRENEIHIYYRGGRLWKLTESSNNSYASAFDINYCKEKVSWKASLKKDMFVFNISEKIVTLPSNIKSEKEVENWITAIPILKQCIDEYITTTKQTLERQFQQLVISENNYMSTSNSTDYFIIDIEYVKGNARLDLVAIKWESEQTSRKLLKNYKPKLAFIEMKFGDGALKGTSGLEKHLEDFNEIAKDETIREEIEKVFKQKNDLDLFPKLKNVEKIELSNESPELIFLLAAHDPESSVLINQIGENGAIRKINEHYNVKFAVANFMGYGLYTDCIYDLDEFCSIFKSQIKRHKK